MTGGTDFGIKPQNFEAKAACCDSAKADSCMLTCAAEGWLPHVRAMTDINQVSAAKETRMLVQQEGNWWFGGRNEGWQSIRYAR